MMEGNGEPKERSRGGAYPVKGMGDLETEEIIDTDKERSENRGKSRS